MQEWLAFASIGGRVERAMGIEHTAGASLSFQITVLCAARGAACDFRVKNSAITAEAAIRYERKKTRRPSRQWRDTFAAGRNRSGPSLFLPVA